MDCPCKKNKVAGAAMTKYICEKCNKEQLHGNTGTPDICYGCAKELSICGYCKKDFIYINEDLIELDIMERTILFCHLQRVLEGKHGNIITALAEQQFKSIMKKLVKE